MKTAYYLTLFSASALAWGLCSSSEPPSSAARPTYVKRWRMRGLVTFNDEKNVLDNNGLRAAKLQSKFKLCVCYQRNASVHNTQFKNRALREENNGFSSSMKMQNIFDSKAFLDNKLIQTDRDPLCMELASDSGCDAIRSHREFSRFGVRCSLATETGCLRAHKRQRARRSSESAPELVYTFIEQAVQPGAPVALKCSALGDPPPRFRWTLDGQPIPSHHGASISEGRESGPSGVGGSHNYVVSTLSLGGARVEHGGRYECRAVNSHGSVAHLARLNVYGPPYIRAMNPVKAVAGTEISVWCPYYGFPIDSVKWEGGMGSDPRYQQQEGRLNIINVDKSRDQGGWTCSVMTPGGELARREVQVSVVSPPVVSLSPPPALRAADRAQLTCTVTSGDMPVYFSWLKDRLPVSTALQVEERGAEFYSMLVFKRVSAAHSGLYTCVATNAAGRANASAEVAVKVPPYWQTEPADGAVLLNGSLTVSCDARGHPLPTVYWTKLTGNTETALGAVSEPAVLSNGSLWLAAARADHTGRYRCRADNGVPPPLAKTLNIHVNEPARFESQSANVSAAQGETVRLVCVVRGDSPLAIAWTHAGRPLPNSDYRMSISETRSAEGLRSELVVERAGRRDSGVYRCQGSNPYGRSDHFLHLAVQEPPEPPSDFRVVETTSRSVRVSWRRPYDGNSPVVSYELQYRPHAHLPPAADGWSEARAHNVSVSSPSPDAYSDMESANIDGLEPATAYLVRARTLTAQFASTHTRAVLALTQHEPPSRPPLGLRASAPRPATVELAWQAPSQSSWNGELLGYTVWWWVSADGAVSGGANVGMEFATVRGKVTKYTIEGLEHYTRYSVSVRAFNSAGAGPATPPVNTLTKESVPSEGPRAIRCRAVSPQSLKVEWSPPPAHAHHGALLGYKLLYRPELTLEWMEWDVRGASGASAGSWGAEVKRVSGVETLVLALQPHVNYTVQALAYTAAGDGAPAPPLRCATHQDVPGPPAAIKVVATSATALAVSWLPPVRPSGPLLYYTVFYRELGRERPPQTTRVPAEEAETLVGLGGIAELRPLAEGTTYEAWVTAHSATGEGEPSAPQPATTTARAGVRVLSFGLWTRVGCGRELRLACTWRGDPPPRARWLRADRPLTHDPRARLTPLGHLALHDMDASTSGNYTCSARNTYGSEEVTYRVECLSPPSPPVLALLHADHTEAHLAWRTAHHAAAPPHGFTISWMRLREDNIESEQSRTEIEERTLEMGGEASGVVLRTLSCGAMYSVRAVAHSRAGSSSPSAPLLVRTKPPVLVWEGGGSPEDSREGAELAVWSNSSAVALDARRAVRCGARLVRLQWRLASAASPAPWADADLTALHHRREVVIGELSASTWYTLRLWTTTDTARHQALLYAATTTHSGERLRRPSFFHTEGGAGRAAPGSEQTERVLGAVSLAFAALAALAVTTLLLVLLARRSSLWSCGVGGRGEEGRRCSHSGASTDKSVCVEQQNLRNCQHDYKHDKLSPSSDVYEISPYATFAVGGEAAEHTLQFRTFGLRDNDAPPHRACRHHQHGHRQRSEGSECPLSHNEHRSECELQQLSRYEKVRPRACAATSYCVPLGHHSAGGGGGGGGSGGGLSEVYAGDSSVESGPGSLSPRTHHDHS